MEIHTHTIDKIAFFNGLLSGLALYPQVWRVLQSGLGDGVSLPTFSIILLNSTVWLVYAVHRGLLSLAIASILNIMASGILVAAIILFSN